MSLQRLTLLTAEDRATLQALGQRRQLAPGDLLVAQGAIADALYAIESGFLSVQRDGLTATRVGPGEIVGEMSLVQRQPSDVSLQAELPVTVWALSFDRLDGLFHEQPGLAARLYASLAVVLSARLRILNHRHFGLRQRLARSEAHFRIGQITERHLLPPFVEAVARIRGELDGLVAEASDPGGSDDALADRVATTCDEVIGVLATFTSQAWLLRMGHADLMSFRDTSDLRVGVGAYVFREFFPFFMASTTMARIYARPRGIPDDHLTIEAIDEGLPEGDGQRGVLVDRWFLGRPVCRVRRAARRRMAEALLAELDRRPARTRVCSLATGAGVELGTVLADPRAAAARFTCVDLDAGALEAVTEEAERLEAGDRVLCICCDILELWEAGPVAHIEVHDLAYAVDLCESLDDAGLDELLADLHQLLAPGGRAFLTQLAAGQPDALLLEHVLEWTPQVRSREDLQARIDASPFAGSAYITALEDDLGWWVQLNR